MLETDVSHGDLSDTAQDYNWWWRSIITSGASTVYVFLYAVYYHHKKLDLAGIVPSILYFGYTSVILLAYFLITGTGASVWMLVVI